ncbi:unnamed protein product [Boreogadus saida]
MGLHWDGVLGLSRSPESAEPQPAFPLRCAGIDAHIDLNFQRRIPTRRCVREQQQDPWALLLSVRNDNSADATLS